jgi:hypothetical protein
MSLHVVGSRIVRSVEVTFMSILLTNAVTVLNEEDKWIGIGKKGTQPPEVAVVENESFALNKMGLDPTTYKFNKKTPQLDAAINMLTQILDERLQTERQALILCSNPCCLDTEKPKRLANFYVN